MANRSIRRQNKFCNAFVVCIVSTLFYCTPAFSQSKIDSLLGKLDPQKFAASITKKAKKLEDKILQKSLNVLTKLQKQEEKLYKKMLNGKDSLLAKTKIREIRERYNAVSGKMTKPVISRRITQYIPLLDTFTTTLKLLDENGVAGKIKEALTKTQSLQSRLDQAEAIKTFLRERKQQLKEQFEKLGLSKQLKRINKEVYYYSQQVNEYKAILSDPKKIEKKVIELLSKTKFFQDFMSRNSVLASLFPMPGGGSLNQSGQAGFAGLQTRAQVTGFIQQAGFNGTLSANQLQRNIQNIQSQLTQIRNKIAQYGGGGSELEMPGFRPNSQKTKSFFKRLEYGTNIQSQKTQYLLPATTDFGLSIGYKLNDRSIIGIGTSYKLGWGHGWNNINLTSEGIGLRSFIDWKIKNSWWISGGYEQNYRVSFNRIAQLKDFNAWQRSGLLGMSKTVSLKSKLLKSTKVQLLWDFLSGTQRPRTQPLVFRIGYSFN